MEFKVGDRIRINGTGFDRLEGEVVFAYGSPPIAYDVKIDNTKGLRGFYAHQVRKIQDPFKLWEQLT